MLTFRAFPPLLAKPSRWQRRVKSGRRDESGSDPLSLARDFLTDKPTAVAVYLSRSFTVGIPRNNDEHWGQNAEMVKADWEKRKFHLVLGKISTVATFGIGFADMLTVWSHGHSQCDLESQF